MWVRYASSALSGLLIGALAVALVLASHLGARAAQQQRARLPLDDYTMRDATLHKVAQGSGLTARAASRFASTPTRPSLCHLLDPGPRFAAAVRGIARSVERYRARQA